MVFSRRTPIDLSIAAWALLGMAMIQLVITRFGEALGLWPSARLSKLVNFLPALGDFATNFVGIMAFLFTCVGLIHLANDTRFSKLPLRIILVLFSPLYLPVVGVSIFRPLTAELIIAAYIVASVSATFLAVITAARRGGGRKRIVILAVGLTPVLTAFELVTRHAASNLGGWYEAVPRHAYFLAEVLFVVSPFLAFANLRRDDIIRFITRPHLVAMVFSILVTFVGVGLVNMTNSSELLTLVAAQSLGVTVSLPGGPLVYLVGLFLGSYVTFSFVFPTPRWPSTPSQKRTGLGLLFVWLAGLQPTDPYQFMLMSAGFVYLAMSVVEPKGPGERTPMQSIV